MLSNCTTAFVCQAAMRVLGLETNPSNAVGPWSDVHVQGDVCEKVDGCISNVQAGNNDASNTDPQVRLCYAIVEWARTTTLTDAAVGIDRRLLSLA